MVRAVIVLCLLSAFAAHKIEFRPPWPRRRKAFQFVGLHPASLSLVSCVTAEKITQQVLWLVLFSILAPILGPGRYGEFSIVMVFVGFSELVLGNGVIEVLVTLVEFEQPHAATTNLIAGLGALGLGLLLCAIAPAIGALFQNDAIRPLMTALAGFMVRQA
jgi:O-antigen/teichoic acid export membrane protein